MGRFQFSLGGLLGAIGAFAVALWLLRAGLDSKEIEIVAASVMLLPVILAAAVDRLFGGAAVGDISVARAYCLLAASAWLLAILSIGIAAISDRVSHQLAIMLLAG